MAVACYQGLLQGVNVFVVKRNQHKLLKIILTKSVAFIKFKLYAVHAEVGTNKNSIFWMGNWNG